jgi:hypothetical protein
MSILERQRFSNDVTPACTTLSVNNVITSKRLSAAVASQTCTVPESGRQRNYGSKSLSSLNVPGGGGGGLVLRG